MSATLLEAWYRGAPWLWLLWPLEWLFRGVSAVRRMLWQKGVLRAWRSPVPVLIVGNLSVGGSGKTPLVIALVRELSQRGWKPGVISRGYGGRAERYPLAVAADSAPAQAGDEPVLIARAASCPVVVAPKRAEAARHLLEHFDCDVLIGDDGLQHYALARDLELIAVDGRRGLGNGHCLPAGPLREPASRLGDVDWVVATGGGSPALPVPALQMPLLPAGFEPVAGGALIAVADWCERHGANARVHAVAGIGNPARFFATLRAMGLEPVEHAFADHHRFSAHDLDFDDDLPVVMTQKDAVKCRRFTDDTLWALAVNAELPDTFYADVDRRLAALCSAPKSP